MARIDRIFLNFGFENKEPKVNGNMGSQSGSQFFGTM